MAAKPWLRDYFKRLADNIATRQIVSESDLSLTVDFPKAGWSYKAKTLLEALGYDKEYVTKQKLIRIGTVNARADFLLGRDSNRWILDLKKPGEKCEQEKHVDQIQSYLVPEKIPFGILFSGELAFAFVDPDHECVRDLKPTEGELEQIPKLNLKKHPVSKVAMSPGETRDMVRFFQVLRYDAGMPAIEALARKLTGDYLRRVRSENKAKSRFEDISTIVEKMIESPDESFLDAMIHSSPRLTELRVTPKEMLEMWNIVTRSS